MRAAVAHNSAKWIGGLRRRILIALLMLTGLARWRVLAGGAAVMATMLFATVSPAWAAVELSVTPSLPSNVTVGQTGLAASIQVTNASTATQSTGNVTLTELNLVPACGATTPTVGTGDCPTADADPGVFTVPSPPTGTGEAGTACAGTTFTISGVDSSTGQVTFTPIGGSVVLTPPGTADATCRIDFTINVSGEPTHDAGTAGTNSVQTAALGFALGQSSVDASVGEASGYSLTTVTKAQPGITAAATTTGEVGAPISDTATLAPASPAGPTPTGSITFNLYQSATCSMTPVFSSTVTVTSGPGSYPSGSFTPTSSGTYHWTASYSGDASNAGATTPCVDSTQTTTVTPASTVTPAKPTLATTASAPVAVGGAISDSGVLAGGSDPTGTIEFGLFGPSNPTCSGAPIFTSTAKVGGDGTYSSGPFTPAVAGTYDFRALYTGDAGNTAVESACGAANESVVVSPATSAPVITSVRQSVRRWRAGKSLARISSAKPPVGTTFSFTLNTAAKVGFAFTAKLAGRKVKHGRCVAQTRSNRHKPSCTRIVTAGTLSFTGHAGTNKVSFDGRISPTKKLAAGTYALVVTATDSSGKATSKQLRFTIVK
jgi:hypothetical protein